MAPAKSAEPAHAYSGDWRRVTNVRACPRILVGEPCQGPGCLCKHKVVGGVIDHRRLWVTKQGEPILTAEIYEIDGGRLVDFIVECAGLDLSTTLNGASPYNPGGTFLLIVRTTRPSERVDS